MSTENFDESKLEVFHEEELPMTPSLNLVGRVYSYDGGERRVKLLSRVSRKNGSKRTIKQFPPLTTPEQVAKVAELLQNCSKYMAS